MKIAICLSGHFRSYEQCFETLNNAILKDYNPDIFIATEQTLGYNGGDRGDTHLIHQPLDIEKINKLYKPKKIAIEPKKKWEAKKYETRLGPGSRGAEQMFGMFYGVYKANQLKLEHEKEHNFTYDIVIRCRPDIFFNNKLSKEELLNCQNQKGLWFPKFGNYSGLNDQFAFGDSQSMNLYAELYNNLDKHFEAGCVWHPETILKFNVNYYKLPIFRTNIEYKILRANGHFFQNARESHLGDIK